MKYYILRYSNATHKSCVPVYGFALMTDEELRVFLCEIADVQWPWGELISDEDYISFESIEEFMSCIDTNEITQCEFVTLSNVFSKSRVEKICIFGHFVTLGLPCPI